jgi:cytochrome c-type biogenesis protein CcmH/NrfG
MNEWFLWISLVSLALVAIGVALYPFRCHKKSVVAAFLVSLLGLSGAYFHWGAGIIWQQFVQRQILLQDVQSMLSSKEKINVLITRLKPRLTKTREGAKGWYLLGKLYLMQHELDAAKDAFALAHQLNLDDVQITLHYAQCLWEMNQQVFTPEARKLLQSVLAKHPHEPDALAMLAMDAFSTKHYEDAIHYWTTLLRGLPVQSDEAKAIEKAIRQAKEQMH